MPQRSSRSFHGLQDFLPHARGVVSRGGRRFTAVVTGTSNREVRNLMLLLLLLLLVVWSSWSCCCC